MKKTLGLLGAVTVSAFIVGCGGGSDISGTDTLVDEGTTATANIGTAYYKDSAVAGVNYVCGSESGVTDENGTIKFEIGKGCTFTLGDIHLRDVLASELDDNGTLWEINPIIARVLQTLDDDNDPTNGIVISPSEILLLAENGILNIPTTEQELAEFQTKMGELLPLLPEDVTDAHLLSSRLAGQTLYTSINAIPMIVAFNEDFTGFTSTVMDQEQIRVFYSVVGTRMYFTAVNFSEVLDLTDTYIEVIDGTLVNGEAVFNMPSYKMYFNAEDWASTQTSINDNEVAALLSSGTWQTQCLIAEDANFIKRGTQVEVDFGTEMMTALFKTYANESCSGPEVVNQYSVTYEYMVSGEPTMAADDQEAYDFVNAVASHNVEIGEYFGPEDGTQNHTMVRVYSSDLIEFAQNGIFGLPPQVLDINGVLTLKKDTVDPIPPLTPYEYTADGYINSNAVSYTNVVSDEWTFDNGWFDINNPYGVVDSVDGIYDINDILPYNVVPGITTGDIGDNLGRNTMILGTAQKCYSNQNQADYNSTLITKTYSVDSSYRGVIETSVKRSMGNLCSDSSLELTEYYVYNESYTIGRRILGKNGEKAYEYDSVITGAIAHIIRDVSPVDALVNTYDYNMIYVGNIEGVNGKALIFADSNKGIDPYNRQNTFGNASSAWVLQN